MAAHDALARVAAVVHPSWLRAARARERPALRSWLETPPDAAALGDSDPAVVEAVRRRFAARFLTAAPGFAATFGSAAAAPFATPDPPALRRALRRVARLQLAALLAAGEPAAGAASAAPREPARLTDHEPPASAVDRARAELGTGPRPDPAALSRAAAAIAESGPRSAAVRSGPLLPSAWALGFGLHGLACALPRRHLAVGVAHRLPRGTGRWLLDLDARLPEVDRFGPWARRLRAAAFADAAEGGE